MPNLTSLAALKTYLGISGTSEDDFLTQVLDGIDAAVFNFTKRREELYSSVTTTEYIDGHGLNEVLVLRRRPVTDVTSVHVDPKGYYGKGSSAFDSSTELTEGTHFVAPREDSTEENGGTLIRIGAVWPEGLGNVKVVYVAGYGSTPSDLVLAVHQTAAIVRGARDQGATLKTETLDEYAYEIVSGSQFDPSFVNAQRTFAHYAEVG